MELEIGTNLNQYNYLSINISPMVSKWHVPIGNCSNLNPRDLNLLFDKKLLGQFYNELVQFQDILGLCIHVSNMYLKTALLSLVQVAHQFLRTYIHFFCLVHGICAYVVYYLIIVRYY